ncbi:hypothetical protein CONCODRAFT_12491 [Conidiobolus coronatus NRRL 28638]|uniref:RNI-like protein n=1 Tax=Conidiobolus coronatus (strain ATCC 28846 / CBS 209.66 / NRRL 28638) TaxID=796925 RepID=A0A137NSX3_CONC2|nr:hypothetical protein CONCODRAFT_12491 [Conidiobolus coronatus NRRL 28638]|eukprot:KXN65816.1 hypothetical protein CONCODRAFT_12491 [Conidiobolus coronatus NRRL 28638]
MTRVLRSSTKMIQSKEDSSSKLSISKKSKTIKRREKKIVGIKNEDKKQIDIWNVNSIMSKIFSYTCLKDLVKFNTVCKKWNNLTNPIIHKTVKLTRGADVIKQVYGKNLECTDLFKSEVAECILQNAKRANLVKEFEFDLNNILDPRTSIEFFQTFRFIRNLTIRNCDISQDQVLGMISPLTQLQELFIRDLKIKRIVRKRIYKEAVQLPPTLKKLRLDNIELINNPELFIQSINSHNCLVEFSTNSYTSSSTNEVFLEPFYIHYPSLINLKFYNKGLQTPQSLFKVFENNTQLISLKLSLECWNSELVSNINSNLTNLEEFNLLDDVSYNQIYTDFFANFSQPAKIKKLSLKWSNLTNCSLKSILLNCPQLEELDLITYKYYMQPNSANFFNLSNPAKLKKLTIDCDCLSDSIIDNLLLQCTNLKELDVILPLKWKEIMKSIYEKCTNLERLSICPHIDICIQDDNPFYREFYDTEFFTKYPICKSTISHLTLKRLKLINSKVDYFKNFENLNSIKYRQQICNPIKINMDLWPGYRLIATEFNTGYDIELKRNLIS